MRKACRTILPRSVNILIISLLALPEVLEALTFKRVNGGNLSHWLTRLSRTLNQFSILRANSPLLRRALCAVGMCVLLFCLGLPMCTEGGVYLFQLMDFYSASGMALLWVCFFQTIAIGWFFGTERSAPSLSSEANILV